MWKRIIFCITLFTLNGISTQAQQGFGEIVINGGIAYSPTFNGAFEGYGSYPIATTVSESEGFHDGYTQFICSSITPNIGGAIDIGIIKWLSIGFAASTQNEVVTWTLFNQGPSPTYYSDQVTRTNIAGRLLVHFPKTLTGNYVDAYFGLRIGESLWNDVPSPTNTSSNYNGPSTAYFITASNIMAPSCMVFAGVRKYMGDFGAFHLEIGIGSPYLIEGGLTFKIRLKKDSPKVTPEENPK